MRKILLQCTTSFYKRIVCFFTMILPLVFLCFPSTAQKTVSFDVAKLAISFSVVAGNYQHTNQAMGKFVLTNNGEQTLPAVGWKIYFNIKSDIKIGQEDKAALQIQRQKANLFELSPMASFEGIAPGKNYSIPMLVENGVINKNDQPEGFYLVWDNMPGKGYDIKNLAVTNISTQSTNGITVSDFAETVYKRNAFINREINDHLPKIFPTPASYGETSGSFWLTNNTPVLADAVFKKEAGLLVNELQIILTKKLEVNYASSAKAITLKFKEGMAAEGYGINIDADGVTITATTAAGIFYGIQSFKTILPPDVWNKKQDAIQVPGATIDDKPRFGYRGFMLDVARDFQTKKEVLRVLNLMALYKLNTFHFHITDDEGWRLQIDGLPELTSVGSNRGHSLDEKNNMPAAYGSGAVPGKLYGSGYYSKADFIEILQYARDRHIQVITEIETPGHARAAIKAMDARYDKFMHEGNRKEALKYFLRDTMDKSEYNTPQSFHDNVINVALPSVYIFVEKVVTEVNKLYQQAGVVNKIMHFGGDEVPAGAWEKSPACNQLIEKDSSLQNTNDLWYYYLGKVNNILKSKGILLAGWEEMGLRKTILDGKKVMIPNPEFISNDMRLYVWNNIDGNEDLAYKLANSGYKIILTCVTNFYFDMIQYKTYDEPGYYWGGITDISKAYEFIPFDYFKNVHQDQKGNSIDPSIFQHKQRLTDYGKNNVLGLQAAIWGETIKGPLQLEYMLLPRLAALSERAWAIDPEWAAEKDTLKMQSAYNNAWSSFVQVVGKRQLNMLNYYNGGYNYRIPPAGAMLQKGNVVANTQFPGLDIYYTSDGSEPSLKSPVYNNAVTVKGIIKLKVFNETGRSSYTTIIENK